MQVEAEQLSHLLQQMQLGEVAPIAAVPAPHHTTASLNNNNNNNKNNKNNYYLQAFQLIVLARYLLGVPKPYSCEPTCTNTRH